VSAHGAAVEVVALRAQTLKAGVSAVVAGVCILALAVGLDPGTWWKQLGVDATGALFVGFFRWYFPSRRLEGQLAAAEPLPVDSVPVVVEDAPEWQGSAFVCMAAIVAIAVALVAVFGRGLAYSIAAVALISVALGIDEFCSAATIKRRERFGERFYASRPERWRRQSIVYYRGDLS
jgi:hypothetical protein